MHGYFYRQVGFESPVEVEKKYIFALHSWQAYLRTTSSNFTLATKDRFVHLNNDAVQRLGCAACVTNRNGPGRPFVGSRKHGDSYGKFEAANKMSLSESRLRVEHLASPKVLSFVDKGVWFIALADYCGHCSKL